MSDLFEPLESRRLFAGVILTATGRTGGIKGWQETLAADVAAKLGGNSQVPRYTLKVADNGGVLEGSITHVGGTAFANAGAPGQIIVYVDYQAISTEIAFTLNHIAQVAVDELMNTTVDGVRLAELPIHAIGLSRGSGLIDEIAKHLGESGIWVDQESYLDPLPIHANGDAPPTIYDNVAFVDNYWRTDGNPNNYNGSPVDGAYNLNVQWLDNHNQGYSLPHIVPAGYYIGTIDFNAIHDGEGPIYSDWYGTDGHPDRDKTGFYYSQIIGGPRPLGGVWTASGGTGTRTTTTQDGVQWPNLTDLSVVGGNNFGAGRTIQLQYIHQDRDSASTVTFYLDTDQNPYNDNFADTLGSDSLAQSSSIVSTTSNVSTTGLSPGNYWICAKVADAQGNQRIAYSQSVQVNDDPPPPPPPPPPPSSGLGTDNVLHIYGTSGNDVIKFVRSSSNSNRLLVSVNGTSSKYVLSNVHSIIVDGSNGDDVIVLSRKNGAIAIATRLNGGAGDDSLTGGNGKDSLFGGNGDDSLVGGAGKDKLVGGDGDDSLFGGSSIDRLYGQAGTDSFSGSKKIERMDITLSDVLTL